MVKANLALCTGSGLRAFDSERFSRWDTESRGFLNYTDFKNVVRSLTYRHLGQKEDVQLGWLSS